MNESGKSWYEKKYLLSLDCKCRYLGGKSTEVCNGESESGSPHSVASWFKQGYSRRLEEGNRGRKLWMNGSRSPLKISILQRRKEIELILHYFLQNIDTIMK